MKKKKPQPVSKQPVIIVQDGALDELMSLVLLGTMPDVNCLGIGVVNADCLAAPTVEVSNKILQLMSMDKIPITTSNARAINAFPWTYRQYSMMANLLPMLNRTPYSAPIVSETTEEMLVRQIIANQKAGNPPVRLLVLSPLTPIATVLKTNPEIISGIQDILWMGGAVLPNANPSGAPQGNVDPGIAPGANANAEWNAYWDPFAVREVMASGVSITMFPLNATNLVMLSPEIVLKFAPESAQYPLYALAGQMYSMVAFEAGYAFWDTVTTAYVDRPDLYTVEEKRLDNVLTGSTQGNIFESKSGYAIQVVTEIDVEGFYQYIFEQWKYLKSDTLVDSRK